MCECFIVNDSTVDQIQNGFQRFSHCVRHLTHMTQNTIFGLKTTFKCVALSLIGAGQETHGHNQAFTGTIGGIGTDRVPFFWFVSLHSNRAMHVLSFVFCTYFVFKAQWIHVEHRRRNGMHTDNR